MAESNFIPAVPSTISPGRVLPAADVGLVDARLDSQLGQVSTGVRLSPVYLGATDDFPELSVTYTTAYGILAGLLAS